MINEIKNLPHVRSDFVRLEKKLGTGSFGEVWEGVATQLPMRDKETRVAIKTLHPGYEESEKIKFMKEAILMNNFDHPNIVKLLGVCLEGPKEYLVLELMEGGDLLNFLKNSSPTDSSPSQLSLRDVLCMLIDVGRGCAYLESNRHVHRDLAARNCLISSETPHHHRVTKIADFGLARGVHNSEHYKVVGSRMHHRRCILIQSDVWAFGVLMYEIVALGQQPYPIMSNSQVLAHVRKGGTPAKPLYCPDQLYKIMQLCWVYDKDRRPCFSDILNMFEKLRDKIEFQDSTSSERMELERSISHQEYYDAERLSESFRFGKSGSGSYTLRKQSAPLMIRSTMRDINGRPLSSPCEIDITTQVGRSSGRFVESSISTDTVTTVCESSSQPPSFANSSRSEIVVPLNPSYEATFAKKISFASDSEKSEDIPHSRSWAGPSHRRVIQPSPSSYAFAIRPSQSDRNSSQGSSRKNRPTALLPSSSYEKQQRNRVSQV
ncbi:hypothetical protein KIN20_016195 [Parelaphostrongylus tenuis]|uniref:receptor protein-tyrosine kinase n=1 Tax=Parelaphostrongylus tenuis TaxID=148309 RepID=A0AAD5MJM4_PARTN|nr:hypothetical protein KIN20_016195 [Parelaphostrongylus tenuis]